MPGRACHEPSLALSLFLRLFLCKNFRMKPRMWLSFGVNCSRPRIALITTVIFHEFYFIIFISFIILNYGIVVIYLNFLYLIWNSKFIIWKMENDVKSLVVELAHLHAWSVWRFREKMVQIVRLAEIERVALFFLLLYIVTKIETRT